MTYNVYSLNDSILLDTNVLLAGWLYPNHLGCRTCIYEEDVEDVESPLSRLLASVPSNPSATSLTISNTPSPISGKQIWAIKSCYSFAMEPSARPLSASTANSPLSYLALRQTPDAT